MDTAQAGLTDILPITTAITDDVATADSEGSKIRMSTASELRASWAPNGGRVDQIAMPSVAKETRSSVTIWLCKTPHWGRRGLRGARIPMDLRAGAIARSHARRI